MCVHVRIASVRRGSNEYHNLCLEAEIRKNVYPRKPQFYFIKVGCNGVYVTRTCLHDVHRASFRLVKMFITLVLHGIFLFKFCILMYFIIVQPLV